MIELLKSLHSIDKQYEDIPEFTLHKLVYHSIFLLNSLISIKGFGEFDCQAIFLKNEGINALYGIKIVLNTF